MIEKDRIIDGTLAVIFISCIFSLCYFIYHHEEPPIEEPPEPQIIFIVMNSYDNTSCK